VCVTACECNETGSERCNHRSGVCECWPNVIGLTCDRCAVRFHHIFLHTFIFRFSLAVFVFLFLCPSLHLLSFHNLCGSNKLLYERCAKSMGRPKFRPPLHSFHVFQLIFLKLKAKKGIQDTTPHARFGWRRKMGRGSAIGSAFFITFCVLSFSVFLSRSPSHTVRPITTSEGSKRVRNEIPFGGLNDKRWLLSVQPTPKHDFGSQRRHLKSNLQNFQFTLSWIVWS